MCQKRSPNVDCRDGPAAVVLFRDDGTNWEGIEAGKWMKHLSGVFKGMADYSYKFTTLFVSDLINHLLYLRLALFILKQSL
jgi:hypothetical protein